MKTHEIIMIAMMALATPVAGQQWPEEVRDAVKTDEGEVDYNQWGYFNDDEGGRIYVISYPETMVGLYDLDLNLQHFTGKYDCDKIMDHTIWPSYADDIESRATAAVLGNGRLQKVWIMDGKWTLIGIANEDVFAIYIRLKQ